MSAQRDWLVQSTKRLHPRIDLNGSNPAKFTQKGWESRFLRIFIAPWSEELLKNRLFQKPTSNNEDNLWIWSLFKQRCDALGIEANTIDYFDGEGSDSSFMALGRIFTRFRAWNWIVDSMRETGLTPRVLLQSEPFVTSPNMYVNIDSLYGKFTKVLYSCKLGRTLFARKSFRRILCNQTVDSVGFLQPHWALGNQLNQKYFAKDGRSFLVMMLRNKIPVLPYKELYSARISAVNYFGRTGDFALYGEGWTRRTFYPRLLHARSVDACYKGILQSREEYLATMSNYTFAICFENCSVDGYVTERIFDCMSVGTIPIYLGAPDISAYVPESCFVNAARFESPYKLHRFLTSLEPDRIQAYKENIARFMNSSNFDRFRASQFSEHLVNLATR